MKKSISLFLILTLFFLSSPCFATSQAIDSGVVFIYSNQRSDGHWDGKITDDYYTTTEILNTLQSLGRTGNEYLNGIGWVLGLYEQDIDFLSLRVFLVNSPPDFEE